MKILEAVSWWRCLGAADIFVNFRRDVGDRDLEFVVVHLDVVAKL